MKKQRLVHFLRKYGLLILSICFACFFVLYYQSFANINYAKEVRKFQKKFTQTHQDLNAFLDKKKYILEKEGLPSLIKKPQKEDFFFHIYSNDSLIYWNTTQLPISRFADLHYPSSGIVHLQNGWYYGETITIGEIQLVASFLIKNQYPYENKDLRNDFNATFKLPFKGNIILEKENAYPVYKDQQFLFAIYPYENQNIASSKSDILLSIGLITLSLILLTIFQYIKRKSGFIFWTAIFGLITIRYLSLTGNWFGFLQDITAFQPTLYASSKWFPNFGEYLINCLVIIFIAFAINLKLPVITQRKKFSSIILIAVYGLILVYSEFVWELYKGIVENSSISIEVNKLFSLNFYSFLSMVSMGALFYCYYQLTITVIQELRKSGTSFISILIIWLISGCLYISYAIFIDQSTFYLSIWPLMITISAIVNIYKFQSNRPLSYGIILLSLFAVYISINLQEFYNNKEQQERELFANQLSSDQDIPTEVEYTKLEGQVAEDPYIHKVLADSKLVGVSEFKDAMERSLFNGFWERYDIEFFLFNSQKEPLINYKNVPGSRRSKLEAIITKHSSTSEIDSNIYFIKDFTSQYCYIIRQPILEKDSSIAWLYCALKSKKIPEKIGFPRLLISPNAKVFETLENYSIAKYYNGKLVSHNGKFSYPSDDSGLIKRIKGTKGYFDSDGYNHYVFRRTQRDTIILSRQNFSTIQFFTSFSYLFSFYGIFLLIPIYLNNKKHGSLRKSLTLALRIQMVLIGMVFIALVAFGWGSGLFVSKQYQEHTNDLIREKIHSIETELNEKLGEEEELSIVDQGNYIEYLLQNLSSVFVTDINLYDTEGYLLASSRPKVYNIGLVSEQMDPAALYELRKKSKSEFYHQEKIGNLDYLSGFIPLTSNEGNLLAYLNLQHFGQQQEFVDQIQQFLVAIMNVFILLLAFSITGAIFVSRWLTHPLRVLQNSFAKVELGKFNEPIRYTGNDEIGILVRQYNNKLQELAFAAQQLAQSEREHAWREMAKQVAHEIKNPLTPMKLSLQHLQRVFNPDDPLAKEKLEKVSKSIIEQIDTLATIANEFSNFAKMPKSYETKVDLVTTIDNVILFFQQESTTEIEFFHATRECFVLADKDLMLRVFNNLIKNAIQAIPEYRTPSISVYIHKRDQIWRIEIKDNGTGIPEEQKKKMFVPYFTTKSTGTGLGLAMVKQIIEMYNGVITYVTSNQGTTFIIELPVYKEHESPQQ